MSIAVFGATGFMGYNFVKLCHKETSQSLLAYTGSPDQLVNLSRHRLAVQPVNWAHLDQLVLPKEVDTIVNFSHPFGKRSGLDAEQQIDIFGTFVRNNARGRKLRLIQLSSMVVYEPFRRDFEFPESFTLETPKPDDYSRQKVFLENATANWGVPVANLRPTIVYGPFGVDFTDLFLNGFACGDVGFHDLNGKIQPIFVDDISRVVLRLIDDFSESPLNLGGPEVISWRDYLDFYQSIVAHGQLHCRPEVRQVRSGNDKSKRTLVKTVVKNILRDPAFRDLIQPLVERMPQRLRRYAKSSVDAKPVALVSRPHSTSESPPPYNTNQALLARLQNKLASDFFGQDRLVSLERLRTTQPGQCLTRLSSTRERLTNYFQFRFCDSC